MVATMILVTGATGKLGQFVVRGLLDRGVSPKDLRAFGRDAQKALGIAELGVHVALGNYDDPVSLDAALAGVDTLVFVSSSELGARAPGHLNVVAAAKKAQVKRIVYTSAPYADTSPMDLAQDHLVTENAIRESGVPFTLLRNSWYFENYTENLGSALEHGVLLGAGGDGKYSFATRKDFADAAVAVATQSGHDGKVYELGGEPGYTLSELAAEIAKQSGKPVAYVNLTPAEFEAKLVSFGLPHFVAHLLADADGAASNGYLQTKNGDLERLLGHPPTRLADAVRSGLGG